MKYAKVARCDAENAKRLLSNLGAFDRSRNVRHSRSYVYFPVLDTDAKAKKLISKAMAEIVEIKGARPEVRAGYNEKMSGILNKRENKYIARGYELLGNIAIIEISDRLKSKEKAIADALMGSNPRVKTVLAKAGAVHGVYRTRSLRYVSGARNYVATYNENGCAFRFDVRRVFFSGKLSYERSRVSSLVHEIGRAHV
jgi:tRNA (guanine37-N1)-methyltransferase